LWGTKGTENYTVIYGGGNRYTSGQAGSWHGSINQYQIQQN
jgi:hypothetical protein